MTADRTDNAIYLDNAATTRVADSVAALVTECMLREYGNPSSAHHMGIAAERRIRDATAALRAAIGDPDGALGDVVWTSGGTESDGLGVIGAARALERRGKHVLFSAIEHPAVRASAEKLAAQGWRTDEIPVDGSGAIDPDRVAALASTETSVCAVMLVNNEIGVISPVAEIARAVKARAPHAHIHCDAVQALGKLPVDVGALGADSVAFAAHKLHGPKGTGALWLRKGARVQPLWEGGGQQGGVRSGTLAVPGIAGMGAAAALAMDALDARRQRWREFGGILWAAALETGVEVRINGDGARRSDHIVSLAFRGVPAEPLLHVLESRGVLVSAGSACSERDRKPSPVLSAIGLPDEFGTLRFSFGRDTTLSEVERAARIMIDAVGDFR